MSIKKRAAKKPIDYKQGKVYKIVNDVNDMIYIGSTVNTLTKRFWCHRSHSKTMNTKFYTATREVGIDHFRIILIELFPCTSKSELEAREYELTNTVDKALLYNSRMDGKHSPEVMAKIKEKLGEHGGNFKRGCIAHFKQPRSVGFAFSWMEDGKQRNKNFYVPGSSRLSFCVCMVDLSRSLLCTAFCIFSPACSRWAS